MPHTLMIWCLVPPPRQSASVLPLILAILVAVANANVGVNTTVYANDCTRIKFRSSAGGRGNEMEVDIVGGPTITAGGGVLAPNVKQTCKDGCELAYIAQSYSRQVCKSACNTNCWNTGTNKKGCWTDVETSALSLGSSGYEQTDADTRTGLIAGSDSWCSTDACVAALPSRRLDEEEKGDLRKIGLTVDYEAKEKTAGEALDFEVKLDDFETEYQ